METEPAIDVENLTVSFVEPAPITALEGISFSIPHGALVSIVGPSGGGKSTLLKAIAGFVTPTAGTLRCLGRPVRGPSNERTILFQEDSNFPWKTAMDNVAFALECQGFTRAKARARAVEWLRQVGLDGFENFYPAQLSGGMQQRVGLARTFASSASILLLDEPFRSLDRITRESAWQVLLDLWKEGAKTVLLVTHDAAEAIFLSDFIVVLAGRPGRLASTETVTVPRPRSFESLFDQEAIELQRRIHKKITIIPEPRNLR